MNARVPHAPPPIVATAADLPAAVSAALRSPADGRRAAVRVSGTDWATMEWGETENPPVLLVHGVTASSGIWWRVGPALAAAARRVVAVDLPGHGATGHWEGRHRFRDSAADLVAFLRAADLDRRDVSVIGHSWGAMIAAALPVVGLRPRTLILLDPPALSRELMGTMLTDPVDRKYDDIGEASRALRGANPAWSDRDVMAKAEALTRFDVEAARAILLDNGDWDGGLRDVIDGQRAGVDTWIVRGEPAFGGMTPDEALPALAQVIGTDHILTIAGGAHSPQRMHPEATLAAFLRALRT